MITKYTISNDPEFYEAWPDITLTKSGKLLTVFAQCATHLDRSYTQIMLCESSDRGRSWSPKRTVTHATTSEEMFFNCPRIVTMKDDRICMIVDKNLHGMKAETTPQSEVVLYFSDNDGDTWGKQISTPVRGIVPDQLLELENGRWIISTHYLVPESGNLEQFLWYSDDRGTSWSKRITVAKHPEYNLCEASLLPVGDNKIVAFIRENSGMGYDCMKTISEDNGETWSEVINFPLPACHRPVAGLLNDGNIFITYRFMQGGKGWLGSWTQNLFGAFTDQESALALKRNDARTRIIPIDYDRSSKSDLGYSGHIQFPDGEIYIVNYLMDDAKKAQIRGYSFHLEDFIINQ